MKMPKEQKMYAWILAIMCLLGMCAGCAQEINYYPNVSKPSRFTKKLTRSERQYASEWYANRFKRMRYDR